MTVALSVLDLSPIPSGATAIQALHNTLDLARAVDTMGYTRYWMSEHHNSTGLASAAPEILIGHVAAVTTRIRVGSGGIMLPNHTALKVVETFRLLAALHPDRIDLGIGRAPGTDQLTAFALRRSKEALMADDFPEQLAELLAFSTGHFPDGHPFQAITAIPAEIDLPPIWLLGSSDYSAQVAAALGLGFAFAHHINPRAATTVMRYYHDHFVPSAQLQQPHAILTVSAVCADTEAQAETLASSLDLMFLQLQTGRLGALPSPAEAAAYPYTPAERAQVRANQSRRLVGDPASVQAQLNTLATQTQADEIMITTMVHDHAARVHSYELLADVFELQGNSQQQTAVPVAMGV